MKCGAKTRAGTPCAKNAMVGRERCRNHGGAQKRGAAHHLTTTGRYSRSMPVKLAASFDAALKDAALLELREDVALSTADVEEALRRLDRDESGALWLRLRKRKRELVKARSEGDHAEQAAALNDILQMIERGATDAEQMRELRAAMNHRKAFVEAERRRLMDAHQVVTIERFMVFVGAISAVVQREVTSREHRARILDGIARALEAGPARGGD
jgi:hypothetical protein